ncbi:hypothetical protein LTR22_027962, partial [Elasticomyces elasticus]
IKSVGLGWGVLMLAGGGSYYFAKRSINAERDTRALLRAENTRPGRDIDDGTGLSSAASTRRKQGSETASTVRSQHRKEAMLSTDEQVIGPEHPESEVPRVHRKGSRRFGGEVH